MPTFLLAQGMALGAGALLLAALGPGRVPVPLFLAAAWLGGTGVLAVERLLLAQAGLPWTAGNLALPWLILAAYCVLRPAYCVLRQWRTIPAPLRNPQDATRTLISKIQNPKSKITLGWVVDVAAGAAVLGWAAALWWQATNTPLDGWDAWAMWFLKGRALYQADTIPAAFFTDPHYLPYAHLDYPLLVPLTIAQTYAWTGDQDALMKGWWAWLAGAAAVGLYWGGAGGVGRAARLGGLALVLSVPELVKHAAGYYAGYADLPLAVLALFGAIFLYRWLREPTAGAFAAGALFFGLAGFTKNEGLVTAGAGLAGLAGLALARRRPGWPGWLGAGAVAGLTLLPWQAAKSTYHLTSDIPITWATVQAQYAARLEPITQALVAQATDPARYNWLWPLLPLLGLGALLLVPRGWLRTLPLLLLITAQVGATVLAYISTPYDLAWHLQTSADRVVFQPVLIVLFLATLYLGLLFDRGVKRET